MDRFLSNKLRVISFIAMVMVVFIHANNVEVTKGYNSYIQILISDGISRVAVPLFFSISAYLFFLNLDGSPEGFLLKFRKRFRTLVVPYIFWSCWGLLIYFILQLIPFSRAFFNGNIITSFSLPKLLDTIFLNPLTYQLWFVRDLMVLFFLSPFIYLMITRFSVLIVLVLMVIWYFGYSLVIVSPDSAVFFVAGAFISIKKPVIPYRRLSQAAVLITAVWLTLLLYKTFIEVNGTGDIFMMNLLKKSGILIGVCSVWLLYDKVFQHLHLTNKKAYGIFSFSFFLYAFHEPFLTIVEKLLFYLLGEDKIRSLIIYFTVPLIVIPFSLLTGYLLKKGMPRFYELITGGR